jgi:hypothetical protein
MIRRLRIPLVSLVLLLLGALGWYQFAPGRAPEGQSALATVTDASLDAIRQEFNQYADRTRIVLLLSPT